jgi:hypothetical protein
LSEKQQKTIQKWSKNSQTPQNTRKTVGNTIKTVKNYRNGQKYHKNGNKTVKNAKKTVKNTEKTVKNAEKTVKNPQKKSTHTAQTRSPPNGVPSKKCGATHPATARSTRARPGSPGLRGECVSEGGSRRVGISVGFWVSRCGFLVGFMALFNYFGDIYDFIVDG